MTTAMTAMNTPATANRSSVRQRPEGRDGTPSAAGWSARRSESATPDTLSHRRSPMRLRRRAVGDHGAVAVGQGGDGDLEGSGLARDPVAAAEQRQLPGQHRAETVGGRLQAV